MARTALGRGDDRYDIDNDAMDADLWPLARIGPLLCGCWRC